MRRVVYVHVLLFCATLQSLFCAAIASREYNTSTGRFRVDVEFVCMGLISDEVFRSSSELLKVIPESDKLMGKHGVLNLHVNPAMEVNMMCICASNTVRYVQG